MRAAEPVDGGDFGGGGGSSGGGSPLTPQGNPLLNWGPLASASDSLFVPGVSDPLQGSFSYPRQDPNPVGSKPDPSGPIAPAERKPVFGPESGGAPSNKTPFGGGMFGTFLRGIMTPAQYNRYGSDGGNPFLVGRQ